MPPQQQYAAGNSNPGQPIASQQMNFYAAPVQSQLAPQSGAAGDVYGGAVGPSSNGIVHHDMAAPAVQQPNLAFGQVANGVGAVPIPAVNISALPPPPKPHANTYYNSLRNEYVPAAPPAVLAGNTNAGYGLQGGLNSAQMQLQQQLLMGQQVSHSGRSGRSVID